MPWSDVPEESVVLYGLHRNVDPAIILFDELGHLAFEKDTVVFFGSEGLAHLARIPAIVCRRASSSLSTRTCRWTRGLIGRRDRLRRLCRQ